MFLPQITGWAGQRLKTQDSNKHRFCRDLWGNRPFEIRLVILAGQVLLSRARKEAALDLHSPFSTSHIKPLRLADRSLASPFLTFLPFASFELWPQQWGRFFLAQPQALDGFSFPPAVAEMRILPLGKISAEKMEVMDRHLP